MNKNIVIIVMRYLSARWARREFVELFGDEEAERLWCIYVDRFTGNPWLFFDTALTEEQQNIVTIRAQTLSLAPKNRCDENALAAMTLWPAKEIESKLKKLLYESGKTYFDEFVGKHDFICFNCVMNEDIKAISYDDGDDSILLYSEYQGQELVARYESCEAKLMAFWISKLKEKYAKKN